MLCLLTIILRVELYQKIMKNKDENSPKSNKTPVNDTHEYKNGR